MKKNPNLLWITVIVLGWLFDFLFWGQSFGINFAIFTVLCLVGGFLILWMDQKHAARGTLWLIPLILFFAAITFVRAESMTVFLGVVLTIFLMGVFAINFLGGRWFRYGMADYFNGFLRLIGSMIARPIIFTTDARNEQKENGVTRPKVNPWPIVRGIVIALPIVAIFAALLASADTIFSNELNSFLKLFFDLEKIPEYIFRFCYILVIAYALAGTFLHAASQSKDEKLVGEDKPVVSQFLGFTETTIVLGSVAVLFAAFVIVQFQYFFGGQANINIQGFTYSEYARRGFGELVAVAFFSLLMILGLGAITRRENETQRRVYSGLSVVIVLLVMVMLVSAYQRLYLYETAYGFSRLRTYTHVALIWIGLLLAAAVVLEILRRERFMALAILTASLGFAISLSLLNVDGFIVKQNVWRATQGKELDVAYLLSLSTDSVPVLANEFQSSSLSNKTQDAVGAALACRMYFESTTYTSVFEWRSFTISDWQTRIAMNNIQSQLEKYKANYDSSPQQVLTPAGGHYDCFGYGMGD